MLSKLTCNTSTERSDRGFEAGTNSSKPHTELAEDADPQGAAAGYNSRNQADGVGGRDETDAGSGNILSSTVANGSAGARPTTSNAGQPGTQQHVRQESAGGVLDNLIKRGAQQKTPQESGSDGKHTGGDSGIVDSLRKLKDGSTEEDPGNLDESETGRNAGAAAAAL